MVERTKHRLIYRVWPTMLVFILGLSAIGVFAAFVANQFRDQDLGLVMAFLTGILGGIPCGLLAIAVWDRRNPW